MRNENPSSSGMHFIKHSFFIFIHTYLYIENIYEKELNGYRTKRGRKPKALMIIDRKIETVVSKRKLSIHTTSTP